MILSALSSLARAAVLQVPAEYPTPADAIAAAVAGDTVEIGPGAWTGPLVVTVDLSLVGTGGSALTSVHGLAGSALAVTGATVSVTGLTLTADPGTPIVSFSTGAGSLTDVVVSGYHGPAAALVAVAAPLTLSACLFTDNLGGHLAVTDSPVVATDVDLVDGGDISGKGVDATRSTLSFVGGTIRDHEGIAIGTGGPATFQGVTFAHNRQSIAGSSPVTVEDSLFEDPVPGPYANQCSIHGTDVTVRRTVFDRMASGSAVVDIDRVGIVEDSTFLDIGYSYNVVEAFDAATFTFRRNLVSGSVANVSIVAASVIGNTVVEDSVFVGNQPGTDVVSANDGGTLLVSRCTFDDNVTTVENPAGVVYASRMVGDFVVADSVFRNNHSHTMVTWWEGAATIDGNLFVGNELTDAIAPLGDGSVFDGDGYTGVPHPTVITQNTVVGTTVEAGVTGHVLSGDLLPVGGTFRNNLVVGNHGGVAIGDAMNLTYNLFWDNDADLPGGAVLPVTNVAADPLFDTWRPDLSAGAQDLVLLAGSPAIDAGDPSVLDLDGSVSDIGFTGGPDPDGWLAIDADVDGSSARFDCDDGDAGRFPGAIELCNDVDQDCDGDAHTGLVYDDADGDGWGDAATVGSGDVCAAGVVTEAGDCDDADPAVVGTVPLYADADGDGFGAGEAIDACPEPGLALEAGDCDDADPALAPDVAEQCDGVDQNCDGGVDEGATSIWYVDADGDGAGDEASATEGCGGDGLVAVGGDCDDADPSLGVDCGGSDPVDEPATAGGCGCDASGGGGGWLAVGLVAALGGRRRRTV